MKKYEPPCMRMKGLASPGGNENVPVDIFVHGGVRNSPCVGQYLGGRGIASEVKSVSWGMGGQGVIRASLDRETIMELRKQPYVASVLRVREAAT